MADSIVMAGSCQIIHQVFTDYSSCVCSHRYEQCLRGGTGWTDLGFPRLIKCIIMYNGSFLRVTLLVSSIFKIDF